MQVAGVSQRVAKLRSTVPHQLAQQLTQHLQHCRPVLMFPEELNRARVDDDAATASEHASATDQQLDIGGRSVMPVENASPAAADAVAVVPLSPAPAALQSMCKAAVQRMPGLR